MRDKIFNLEDGSSYYTLENIRSNKGYYVLAAKCDLDKDDMDTGNLIVCEVTLNGEDVVTKRIEDENLASRISAELIQKFRRNNQ